MKSIFVTEYCPQRVKSQENRIGCESRQHVKEIHLLTWPDMGNVSCVTHCIIALITYRASRGAPSLLHFTFSQTRTLKSFVREMVRKNELHAVRLASHCAFWLSRSLLLGNNALWITIVMLFQTKIEGAVSATIWNAVQGVRRSVASALRANSTHLVMDHRVRLTSWEFHRRSDCSFEAPRPLKVFLHTHTHTSITTSTRTHAHCTMVRLVLIFGSLTSCDWRSF